MLTQNPFSPFSWAMCPAGENKNNNISSPRPMKYKLKVSGKCPQRLLSFRSDPFLPTSCLECSHDNWGSSSYPEIRCNLRIDTSANHDRLERGGIQVSDDSPGIPVSFIWEKNKPVYL